MKCSDFEARLNAMLDERRDDLTLSDKMAAHAGGCASCREIWLSYRGLMRGLAEQDPLDCPVDLSERVLSQIHAPYVQTPRPSSTATWYYAGAWSGLAALVLVSTILVFALAGFRGGDRPPAASMRLAGEPMATDRTSTARTGATHESPLVRAGEGESTAERPAGADGVRLPDELERLTPEQIVETQVTLFGNESLADGEGQRDARGWVDQMAASLSPLERSTRDALEGLIDALVLADDEGSRF